VGSDNLYSIFQPLSNKLKCDVSVSIKGDRFKTFPRVQWYENFKHILNRLLPLNSINLTSKVYRILKTVLKSLEWIISENHQLWDELVSLIPDFELIRGILGKKAKGLTYIKKHIYKWVYMLKSRMKITILFIDI